MAEGWYRFFLWFVHKIGIRALVSLLLLAVILGTISSGLNRIVGGLQIQTLTTTTLIALLFAWMLARSRQKEWQAGIAVIITGLAIVLLSSGELNQELLQLARATGRLASEALHWRVEASPPNLEPVLLSLVSLGRTSAATLNRLWAWMVALFGRSPAYDRLAVSLFWGLALWGVAAWAAWAVRRREQPLAGIVPAVGLFAAGLSYTRASPTYLLPVIACVFSLMAWIHFSNRQRAWLEKGADYAEDIYFDLSLWILAFSLGISSLALTASYVSPQVILEFTRDLVQTRSQHGEQVGASLGLESNPEEQKGVAGVGAGSLPRQHLLGSGPELSRQLVMSVQVDAPLLETGNASPSPPPYYWRALTYDVYTGRGWATSATTARDFPANAPILLSSALATQIVRETFRPVKDLGGQIFFSGALIRVDQEARVDLRPGPDKIADIFGATLRKPQESQSYTIQSLLIQAGEAQLRRAGIDYPQWIAERYLQLPDTIPERVVELARGLTANAGDPYAKASAIESYLRTITYTLDVPAPPADRDVADYFLFDLRAGYCDYYATSMVVLSRIAGLPARLVVGYAQGTLDETYSRYIVSEADAHSWAEVYFPGIGWVEFEPTGGRPPIDRPQDLSLLEIPPAEAAAQERASPKPNWLNWLGWGSALLGCLALCGLAWRLGEAWRMRRLPSATAITRLYRNLYQQGKRLETVTPPSATPHEFAEALARQVADLKSPGRWGKTLDDVQPDAASLADLYSRTIYSPRPPSKMEQRQAIHAWERLRLPLWLARWLKNSQGKFHQS